MNQDKSLVGNINKKINNALNSNTVDKISKMKNNVKEKVIDKKNIKPGVYIFIILLFLGIILFLYYDDLKKVNTTGEYLIIGRREKIDNNFEKQMSIASLLGTREALFVKGESYGISFSWDMYIPNTTSSKGWNSNYNNLRPIIRWGESPHIYYNHRKNYLSVMIKFKDNPYYSKFPQINVEVPLQRWNSFIVVINNRNINIFMNGDIVKNYTLNNVPIITQDYIKKVILGEPNNNIIGKLRNFKVYFKPLKTNEILI